MRRPHRHGPHQAERPHRGRTAGGRDLELRRAAGASHSLSVALAAADGANRFGLMAALQRAAGNAAVQRMLELPELRPVQVVGQASHVSAPGGSFSVHGQTDATFDGGTGTMTKQKVAKSTACKDCDDGCVHVTGTLIVKYHVDVVVTMPDVPEGLNECEEGKVRQFITTTLQAHENEHVRRFKTYNGTKSIPINLTGCGQDDVQSQVQAIHDADEAPRHANAQALSDAIDPFTKSVDLSKCQD